MEIQLILKAFLLVTAGVLFLRVAGRKSISQMTLAQTVVMISIGSIIIQPIIETSVVRTLVASAVFVSALIIMEFLQVKFNGFEKFITGKSKVVIDNGQLNIKQLKKLRFTVDQLEMRLRQQGISSIKDVRVATIEPNGQLGYELHPDAKPLTVGEFKKLMAGYIVSQSRTEQPMQQVDNIFDEVMAENHKQPNRPDLH